MPQKALVTGAGGFIGSHLVEALLKQGWHVRALVHYRSETSWGHLAEIPTEQRQNLEVVSGDVRDPYQMQTLVTGCDTVFHLAALIAIPYSYDAPSSYVATNVVGGLNVLEACRQQKVRRLILTSTSEVYGTAQFTPITENHPLHAQSPYAASKIGADQMAQAYHLSFGLPVVILRPFNTYGPRQSLRAVIPSLLAQALSGQPEIEVGNLAAKRDFTFVEDTVSAFLLSATAPGVEGETVHTGSGVSVSISELAQKCLQVANSQATLVSRQERQRPTTSEVELLLCDAAKANRLLGWRPRIGLEEGLARTAEYIRARSYYQGEKTYHK